MAKKTPLIEDGDWLEDRKLAARRQQMYYLPKHLCANDHYSLRYTISGRCVTCRLNMAKENPQVVSYTVRPKGLMDYCHIIPMRKDHLTQLSLTDMINMTRSPTTLFEGKLKPISLP